MRKILTHRTPDLDAVFSIYLMKKYGEEKYPGIREAQIEFVSANQLQDGTDVDAMEKEGVLALDIGGGRFDNHPVDGKTNEDKWDTCASQLVAEDLGVADKERFRFLLPFVVLQDSRGRSLYSKDASHHLMAPPSIMDGLHRYLGNDLEVVEQSYIYIEGLSEACRQDEESLENTAEVFDEILADYLENEYEAGSPQERQQLMDWPARGKSHDVAARLGIDRRREIEKLLLTAARLLANSDDALPQKENERRILFPACVNGLAKIYGRENPEFRTQVFPFFKAMIKREADWFIALSEIKRSAKVYRNRKLTMVAIASKNGLVMKAARYKLKADLVLYFEPSSGAVTVQSGSSKDGKSSVSMPRLAARLRIADLIKQKAKINIDSPDSIGMVEGWYLHPSNQLINRGSPKAPDVEPTTLTYQELIAIVKSEISPEEKLPDQFCPPEECTTKNCAFYSLRLGNCYTHRQNISNTPVKGTLGELFADKFKGKKKPTGRK